ncbi:hypothetical protein [Nocardia abscessus]|uniref:hypothetical protein n=1 Tax=Nocardia abscessus TaxID=120957 RepID=UPI0024582E42|nr:hypothetical protein [Nocardia abscessus]
MDSARTEGRGADSVERKSGRVNDRDAGRQLDLERLALDSVQISRSRWETVAGEKVPDKVRQDIQDMVRDFGDKFTHVIISRADALRAMKLGQSLDKPSEPDKHAERREPSGHGWNGRPPNG